MTPRSPLPMPRLVALLGALLLAGPGVAARPGAGRPRRRRRLRPGAAGRHALPDDRAGARRPRHRGHRRAPGAAHLLLRRRRRRRVEDHRRAARAGTTLSDQASSRSAPSARSTSPTPTRTSSTSAPAPRRSAATSPSAGASTSRSTPGATLAASSASATPARSARSSSIRPTRTSCTPRSSAIRSRNEHDARRLPDDATAARRWQKVLFLSDSTGAVDVELQPGNPHVVYASMWRGAAQAVDDHQRRRRGRHLQEHRRRRHVDAARAAACPPASSARATSPCPPPRRSASTRSSRRRSARGLYRSDDAGDALGARQHHAGPASRAPSTTTTSTPIRPTPTSCTPARKASTSPPTAARPSARCARRTATTTTCGSTRRNGSIFIQSNDGGANVTLDGGATLVHAAEPADRRDLPGRGGRPVSRTACTARSRTTARSSSPACPSAPSASTTRSRAGGRARAARPARSSRTARTRTRCTARCKGQFSRMSLRTGQEQQYWIGAQSLYGNANAGPHLPLPARRRRWRSRRTTRTRVYYGSQYVHRTRDEGVTWETISPDLTANDPRYRDAISGEPITRRRHRRGVLRHALRDPRVAARARA